MVALMKKRNYFHGWYFKQSSGEHTVALIPSYHIDKKGKLFAYIQVISDKGSLVFEFSEREIFIDKKNLLINIGHCIFSKSGIDINIGLNGFVIKGELNYSQFTPIKYDIMGPFKCVPFLQCRHGVISLYHTVNGYIDINGEHYEFKDGAGYIESDHGSSFPQRYLWSQCNVDNQTVIMLSLATIKTILANFNGTIGIVYFKGKEYRFATYLGAKILEFTEKNAKIKQGNMILRLEQISSKAHDLKAPVKGIMKRIIRESPSCKVRYIFSINDEIIFDKLCDNAGFEYSHNTEIE